MQGYLILMVISYMLLQMTFFRRFFSQNWHSKGYYTPMHYLHVDVKDFFSSQKWQENAICEFEC